MKIIRKPVKAFVECPLCNCEYEIKGKDWATVYEDSYVAGTDRQYYVRCPNCNYNKKIVPSEVKCEK